MSYDWHFSDGSHTKLSNWQVHSAVMLIYHAVGVWSYERLESELTTMQMHRNLMNETLGSNQDEPLPENKEPVNIIITVEKLDLNDGRLELAKKAGMPIEEKDGHAYLAKVEFKSEKPVSKEFMNKWTSSMEGHLKYAIKNTMRCEELRSDAPGFMKETLEKILSNDGFVFNPKDARIMMMAFMGLDKKVRDELEEVLPVGWERLVMVCVHVGEENLSAQIF